MPLLKNIVGIGLVITDLALVPVPYRVGDVCSILVKDNPDLKGKAGCWAIVERINNFSVTVRMWDGIFPIPLKPEHLKELPYAPAEREKMRQKPRSPKPDTP